MACGTPDCIFFWDYGEVADGEDGVGMPGDVLG